MAGEDQYIHPIIQAILGAQQLMQQKQELGLRSQQIQSENQSRQDEAKYRQGLLKEAETRLAQEHEHQDKMLDIEKSLRDAQVARDQLGNLMTVRNLIQGGMPAESLGIISGQAAQPNAPGIVGGLPDTRTLTLPGGQQIPMANLPSKQDLLNTDTDRIKQEAAARGQGELGSQLELTKARGEQERQTEAQRETFEGTWNQKKLDWDKEKDKLDRGTRLQIEGMANSTEMKKAQMQYQITPDEMQAGIYGMMTGEIPMSASDLTNPKAAAVYSGFKALGGRQVTKNEQDLMSSYGQLNDLWKKFDDVISQLPSEKSLGAVRATGDAYLMNKVANSGLSVDVKNSLNALGLQMYDVMKNVQGFTGKRINGMDATTINKAILNLGTQEQAQKMKQDLKDSSDNEVVNVLEAGMPVVQQNALYNGPGGRKIPPAWILQKRNPQMESQGYKLNLDDTVNDPTGKLHYDPPGGNQ